MAHVHDLINYGSGDFDDNTTTKANIVLRCIRMFSKVLGTQEIKRKVRY